jgi:tRNA-splicing ligase RtcB (3'-phosphate/5'-hydroxy nucleic acid ligase)
MAVSFGSSCHGAGRELSRHAAIKALRGQDIAAQLGREGGGVALLTRT